MQKLIIYFAQVSNILVFPKQKPDTVDWTLPNIDYRNVNILFSMFAAGVQYIRTLKLA